MKDAQASRSALMKRLMNKGVKLINNAKVVEVTNDTITYELNNIKYTINDADSLLFGVGYRRNDDYINEIKELGNNVYLIGDASKSQSIKEAINSAFELTKNF